jgi:hypothetical protein
MAASLGSNSFFALKTVRQSPRSEGGRFVKRTPRPLTEHGQVLQNGQLQVDNVVIVNLVDGSSLAPRYQNSASS